MARTRFACTECGATSPKWVGRCDGCGAWNSFEEERAAGPGKPATPGRRITLTDLRSDAPPLQRLHLGLGEFDRVTGGGLVPASVTLVGGDPGIGKSTLLLQAAAAIAKRAKVIYISGEEAAEQIRMRARRLGLEQAPIALGAETHLSDIIATLDAEQPALVIIDSIQTMWSDKSESAPGSVGQVRAAAHELTSFAKRRGISVILVGHVTKDGQIAGPRVVEHMVDTVLYFEGERGAQHRILRAVKNRFGPADEIGVFEMAERGLIEVTNPSALFLPERDRPSPGAVVFAGLEGTRPMLVEIQALAAPSSLGTPRRSAVGWDGGRLSMLLAVLEARAGIAFAGLDVYLNVAGGLRIQEPAADLAVAAALLSARFDVALPPETVLFGEIALSGAIRPAPQAAARLREAEKLGFARAHLPAFALKDAPRGKLLQIQHRDLTGFAQQCFGPEKSERGPNGSE